MSWHLSVQTRGIMIEEKNAHPLPAYEALTLAMLAFLACAPGPGS
jgi:hypothetical protein